MSEGRSAPAVSVVQLNVPPSRMGSNVNGPMNHQIKPSTKPQATPEPKSGATYRDSKPQLIPSSALIIMFTMNPKISDEPPTMFATFGRNPITKRTSVNNNPPTRLASAPYTSECKTREPGPSGSRLIGSDSLKKPSQSLSTAA